MSCVHISNGIKYDCESVLFTELSFDTCSVVVTYRYDVINSSNVPVRLDALINHNLYNIIGNTDQIIPANDIIVVEKTGEIDICEKGGQHLTRKGIAVASPLNGGKAGIAEDSLQIKAP